MFRYALFSLFILTTTQLFAQEKPNVLMIVLDDLNDYVGVLDGHPQVFGEYGCCRFDFPRNGATITID